MIMKVRCNNAWYHKNFCSLSEVATCQWPSRQDTDKKDFSEDEVEQTGHRSQDLTALGREREEREKKEERRGESHGREKRRGERDGRERDGLRQVLRED